jgi:hypothetical protein
MDSKFLREVDRLFHELVHDPWRRVLPRTPEPRDSLGDTCLLLEIPLEKRELESISVIIEGNRPTVVLCTTGPRHSNARESDRTTERYRQTFELPEGSIPHGFEARFEAGVLRLRVQLHPRNG